jgi:hypothetical protein
MIPSFCGLAPAMADQLVAAFEEHERKAHANELEEAEKERKQRISDLIESGPERAFTMTKDLLQKVRRIPDLILDAIRSGNTPTANRN